VSKWMWEVAFILKFSNSQVYPKKEIEPVFKTQFSYKETSMMNKFQKDGLKHYHTIIRKLYRLNPYLSYQSKCKSLICLTEVLCDFFQFFQ
jgi:hypothetical protein